MKILLAAVFLTTIPALPSSGAPTAAKTPKVSSATSPASRAVVKLTSKTPGQRFVVIIDEMIYKPQAITVHVGDEVVWVNKDIVPHTVTDRNGRFDSGEMDTGSYRMLVFKQPGTINYYCIYHTMMDGVVTVLPVGAVEQPLAGTVPVPVPQPKPNVQRDAQPATQDSR